MTTIVGQGLAAHRAWASLRSSELFELYREKGPCGVPGADTAATETWRDLLATPEIDLLVLAVPPADRVALGQAARGAGKAVLLEEGLPLSAAEIDQLAEDDGEGAALVGMVLPLRGLLAVGRGILDREWTPATCGGLILSGSAPRAASAKWGPPDAAGPRADGGRLPEVLVRTISPYLDLACQLFGRPVSAHLGGAVTGSAAGSVEFESGARLSLAVTVRSGVEATSLTITDVDQSVTLRGRELRLEDADGLVSRGIPPLEDLRLSSYADMALVVGGARSTGRDSPESTRALADCLDLLRA
ncbi:hypothetical protein [Streptomyces sp. SLBN-118]|uniref:hypothetical protein n=1 Tax=Streptomyces sp. SLBN-118 TaxID=2768454 RepID=UPI00114F50AA|nr:hypothetical protein [Streptomyces sp. SLBN-118]